MRSTKQNKSTRPKSNSAFFLLYVIYIITSLLVQNSDLKTMCVCFHSYSNKTTKAHKTRERTAEKFK